jgi:hypothetical protein
MPERLYGVSPLVGSAGILVSEPGDASLSPVYAATVTLTDAQIKNSPAPIQIVAAPGAGKIILPIVAYVRADTTAGAYTFTGQVLAQVAQMTTPTTFGGFLQAVELEAESNPLIASTVAAKVAMTLSNKWHGGGNADADPDALTNLPYGVGFAGTFGTIGGGHADNTVRFTLLYMIVDV